jgi:RNA polymerase sigma-70 factor, ECF subfamily
MAVGFQATPGYCIYVNDLTFEEVVNAYYQPLYRFAFRLAGSPDEASDLTQETFKLWANKGHQLRDRSRIKTWLFTTMYREFLHQKRRAGRFVPIEFNGVEEALPEIPPADGFGIDADAVKQALAQIEEIYRAPLILFYLEDHSYREIAEILGIADGTVMSRLSRGKALLRQLLEATPQKSIPSHKTEIPK